MDPNANLLEQERFFTHHTTACTEANDRSARELCICAKTSRSRLRELREALRDWIRGGGFEPDWSKAPNARKYYGR